MILSNFKKFIVSLFPTVSTALDAAIDPRNSANSGSKFNFKHY